MMKSINFQKQVLPHVIAVALFYIVTLFFYQPMFFQGESLNQHDILQWRGSAQEVIHYRDKLDREILWTNSMFSGMPTYLVSLHYGEWLTAYGERALSGFITKTPANITFACFLSFYLLLLCFGVRPYLALLGAFAYGLSSFNIISLVAGHNAKVWAVAFMPLVLAGIKLTYDRKLFWGLLLTAFGLGIEIFVNHLQITYYLMLIVLIFGLSRLTYAIKEHELKPFIKKSALLVIAAFLAVAVNFGRLWGVYSYGQYSTRGKSELTKETGSKNQGAGLDRSYVFRWSNGIIEPLTLLVPNFYGGASQQALDEDSHVGQALKERGATRAQINQQIAQMPTYWGDQPYTAGPVYAGAIIVFLFVLGLFFADKKLKTWVVIAVIFGIVLSWGNNFAFFNNLMYDYFPGYNKFRSVSMTITMVLLLMPLLGFVGLEKLLGSEFNRPTLKKFVTAAGITAGFCFILWIFAGILGYRGAVDDQLSQYPGWFLSALRQDRQSMMQSDAFRSFFLILAFAALLYFHMKGKIKTQLVLLIGGVLILADLWTVDRRYLNDDNFDRQPTASFFQPSAADKLISANTEPVDRTLNLMNPWNEARTSYAHFSIGGYHGAKLGRYQELIDYCLSPETQDVISHLQKGNMNYGPTPALNMLNTKFFMAGQSKNAVIPNQGALGNAWLVKNIKPVQTADAEIEAVQHFQPDSVAIVNTQQFKVSQQNFNTQGQVKLTNYIPDDLTYSANLQGQSFVVFSQIYYPKGWEVTIDGKPANMVRVNYVLRGLEVPAGEHTIHFEFKPAPFYVGNKVNNAAAILFLLLVAGGAVWEFKGKKKEA